MDWLLVMKDVYADFIHNLGYRNITPYILKYGRHPVTGAPLKQEDLIPLTFHKNGEGNYLPF